MEHGSSVMSIEPVLGTLAKEAAGRVGVPDEVIREAVAATRSAFSTSRGSGATLRRRCASYFWAVVRRRIVRAGAAAASARFVLATVVEDMSAAGRDSRDAWREIERGWAHQVPREVLEEYRVRLLV